MNPRDIAWERKKNPQTNKKKNSGLKIAWHYKVSVRVLWLGEVANLIWDGKFDLTLLSDVAAWKIVKEDPSLVDIKHFAGSGMLNIQETAVNNNCS